MYVIRNKQTKELVYIDYRKSSDIISGEEVYPKFSSDDMELGRTDKKYIPVHFKIDDNGIVHKLSVTEQLADGLIELEPTEKILDEKVVVKSIEEQVEDGICTLDDFRQQMIEYYSSLAFQKRRELMPDYKLENTALGIYDEETILSYKETVQAFRNEFYRIKELINKSDSINDIRNITANYPEKTVSVHDK